MHNTDAKHYPTYLALVIGMVTSFFLGTLLVEVPFSTGLSYFQGLQHDNLIAQQIRMYENRNAAQAAEMNDSDVQRGIASCRASYDSCAQGLNKSLSLHTISEAAWLAGQRGCAKTLSSCTAGLGQ